MSFVNTVVVVGDKALTNSIIDGSIKTITDDISTTIGAYAFYECKALTTADFPGVTQVDRSAFQRCSALTALVLRSATKATMANVNALDSTPIEDGKGYIYVPFALIDSYKADSKWSTFSNQFRKLEDYTVDGTVTGEVDPTRCRVRFFNDDGTLLGYVMVPNGGTATYDGDDPVCSEDASWPFEGFAPEPTNVTADMDCYAQYQEPITLEEATWAQISEISAAGDGANYFSVGDRKSIRFYGTMGTTILDDEASVYILGFDHNSELEGRGIHFGTPMTSNPNSTLKYIFVSDGGHGLAKNNGDKYFNISHRGSFDTDGSNHGGWAGCDLRYDILGSTDVVPSQYLVKRTEGAVGYDATVNCATHPVENTLMSCLPADLRAVMKPITKWTNNKGGNSSGLTEADVTATVDYLPLLSMYEILGSTGYAYAAEANYQRQYDYFVNGSFSVAALNSDTTNHLYAWTRSPATNSIMFCAVRNKNNYDIKTTTISLGIHAVFMV